MRFFAALAVAALGIGCYAAAAVLWDRRAAFRAWLGRRRKAAEPAGRGAVTGGVLGSLLLGTVLILGSCVGLVGL